VGLRHDRPEAIERLLVEDKLSYLPFAIAPEVLDENHRAAAQQLASLRFYDLRADCPTHAGILLFGTRPLDWIEGAYVQFVRYAGAGLDSDVRSDKTLSGDLLSLLRQIEDLLGIQVEQRPVPVSMLQEQTIADYPERALRELVMNAIMHRSYETTTPVRIYWFEDRVEIHSPGGLYGEATPENFPAQTAYRNPVLAEAMKVLGFVNRFGRGVAVARAELARNGNPAPDFLLDDPQRVVVTVRRRP
jgi:ATP-dependent DNA helicase RecG